jgi:hypothetical protein
MRPALIAVLISLGGPALAQEPVKIGLIVDRIGFSKAWSEPRTCWCCARIASTA